MYKTQDKPASFDSIHPENLHVIPNQTNSNLQMALFSHTGFTPLLQLLDDYEGCRKPQPPTFAPAFDVRELDNSYHLDGELPGVDQSNIEIEFTDAHTLVIKGHTERNYNSNEDMAPTRSPSPGWHQPTVEDEDAESIATTDTASSHEKAQPSPAHFWASERSTGDFQRTFSFTARVDQDSVRANLKNGILSVVVPKQTTLKTKKIRVL
jgi:HSP20 family molecular chaperone IbpA